MDITESAPYAFFLCIIIVSVLCLRSCYITETNNRTKIKCQELRVEVLQLELEMKKLKLEEE
jgi:hypothetical protein